MPGLCEHHTQHNAQCGYVEEQKAHACNHVHTADCYVKELVCEKEETKGHTHEAACYGEDGILQCGQEEEAFHVNTEDCYEQKEDCHHVHDADCQYAAYRPGQPCTWLCDICAFEEVLTEEELPITDIFELVDVQGKVVTQIKIAAEGAGKGTGISEKIPPRSSDIFFVVPVQDLPVCPGWMPFDHSHCHRYSLVLYRHGFLPISVFLLLCSLQLSMKKRSVEAEIPPVW